jgi:hypothetical protein
MLLDIGNHFALLFQAVGIVAGNGDKGEDDLAISLYPLGDVTCRKIEIYFSFV